MASPQYEKLFSWDHVNSVDPPEFNQSEMAAQTSQILPEDKYQAGVIKTGVRLLMFTWNVAEKKPPLTLEDALSLTKQPYPDIYGIGLQEVKLSDSKEWVDAFTSCLAGYNYVRVKTRQMLGVMTLVFVLRPLLPYCTAIESEVTKTGFGGWWGNKGGVSIRLDVLGINLIIVNCHLAAHQDSVAERILDFDSILDSQKFKDDDVENILDHDYVFWMGDMNFRLDNMTRTDLDQGIAAKDYRRMLQNDQLLKCKEDNLVFENFHEMDIQFPPTYKYDVGTDVYDSGPKKRLPAWCDRVLWHTYDIFYDDFHLNVTPVEYTSHQRYRSSDHKPVSATFLFSVFPKPPQRPVIFEPQRTWNRKEVCAVRYSASRHTKTSGSDFIGLYKANFDNLESHITYVYAVEGAEKKKYRREGALVPFPQQNLSVEPGEYCLLYLTKKYSLQGISNTFKIV